jgi:hypothetical protein
MAHDTVTDTSDIRAEHRCVAKDEPVSTRGYRIADVCKVTGLGRTSIYAAIKAGDLVARKYKRCTIVLHDDLATFLHTLPKVS